MNRDSCQKYLEDPEANASHLAECEECRAIADALEASGPAPRISVDLGKLPLAAWEGASHRAWPLVVAGGIAVAVIAGLLFLVSGTSPFEILRGNVPSRDVMKSILRLADGGAIQNAPLKVQILIGISFVLINAIFIALLRRAPRGIDV